MSKASYQVEVTEPSNPVWTVTLPSRDGERSFRKSYEFPDEASAKTAASVAQMAYADGQQSMRERFFKLGIPGLIRHAKIAREYMVSDITGELTCEARPDGRLVLTHSQKTILDNLFSVVRQYDETRKHLLMGVEPPSTDQGDVPNVEVVENVF